MIARDWILETLAELELWAWPIFLWDLYWLDRYLKAARARNPSGLIGYGVTRQGRIHITLQSFGDKPRQDDWTSYAPRAPWVRLAPETGLTGLPVPAITAQGYLILADMTVLAASRPAPEAGPHPLIPP
jgi:hypothetical protein